MVSTSDCYDNAMCEAFFAPLECEIIDRSVFRTRAESHAAVFDFVEGWYESDRRHYALDYVAPMEYETGGV